VKKLNNKLPSSWKEVTLEEWTEIAKIDKEQGAIHYNSEVISILTNIDVDELDIEELQDLVDSCKWSTSEPSKNYKHEVEGMRLKAFNKLTLYEYIGTELLLHTRLPNQPTLHLSYPVPANQRE
jgi:hypothetical protein